MFLRAWKRFRSTAATDWPWLVLEFAAVVLGLTLSFALQDWRDERNTDREQLRLLASLHDDLLVDVGNLDADAALLEQMVASNRLILDEELRSGATPAELDAALDLSITYSGFTPNDTTWRTMEATGSFALVEPPDLLSKIVRLYEQGYPSATEWSHINRDFVLRRMIPYVDEHAPFFEISEDPVSIAGMHRGLPTLLARSQYKNLLRTGRIYKAAQRAVLLRLRDTVQEVADAIEAELATR